MVGIALKPGDVFAGDYRVIRPLNEGGMGAVYVAEQLSTGKQRALKLMLPQLVSDPMLRARFEQEARLGAKVDSDHVVEVVGAGIDAETGAPWLAMELLRGEDLAARVRRHGPMSAAATLEIVEQLCHAVGAAHAASIVHRDLKPENIFIADTKRKGAEFVVKVLDFGIAKVVAEAKTSHTAAVGSPMWMAPEQTERGGSIGPSTDVWAIGLIVFHLLTGRYFWRAAEDEGASIGHLLREVVIDPIPAASQRAAEVGQGAALPPGFDGWFARCVDRSPRARFADAIEQITALRLILEPVVAISGAPRAVQPTAPSADLQTLQRPTALGTQAQAPLPEAFVRPPRAAARSRLAMGIVGAAVVGALGTGAFFATRKRLESASVVDAGPPCAIHPSTARVLASLKEPLHVRAYVTRGLPSLDRFVRELTQLLQSYKESSGGRFDYTVIEPDDKVTVPDAGLVEHGFGEAADGGKTAMLAKGYMGLLFDYGADHDSIAALSPDSRTGLEFWITNKIRALRAKHDSFKYRIGVLAGHDEIRLTEENLVARNAGKPSIQQIITENFPFFSFVDVHADAEINPALDGLVITQPGKDLTESELRHIDRFIMTGKAAAVFAGAVNIKASDPTMSARLDTHGLEKLLGGYGIELRKDAVLDFGQSFHIEVQVVEGGRRTMTFPAMIHADGSGADGGQSDAIDSTFLPFFQLAEVWFPLSSSLVMHPEMQPDATLTIVARSSPSSSRLTSDVVDLKPFQVWKPTGTSERVNLSAVAQGRLRTAFPGNGATQVPEGKVARIFVIGSSQFLANPFARAGNFEQMGSGMMAGVSGDEQLLQIADPYARQALTNSILTFKNTLDWLTGEPDLVALSASPQCSASDR